MGRGEAAVAAHGSVLPAPGGFGISMSRQTPPQLRFSPQSSSGTLTGRWSPWEAAPASASNPVSGSPRPVLREKRSARPFAAGPGTLPPPPGHEGSLTSEPLAQDALQQLAEGHEVRRGVRAGPAALPQPQHPSCGEERERRHPWVPSRGKGRGHPEDSSARPRGGRSNTPARPDPPRLPPLRWAGTRLNFLEAKVGRRGRPGEPQRGPAVGPVRPVPVRGQALLEETRTGAGGPRSPLRALSSGSFLAMGSSSPRARRSRDGGWTGTGSRESGTGNREGAPPQESSGPARPHGRGKPHTHTQVYVYLN